MACASRRAARCTASTCDFTVGCDGFHGLSRRSVAPHRITTFERVYPSGWLGVLSRATPVSPEPVCARHERGSALCSLRSQVLSRYGVQVPLTDTVDDWPDERFGGELKARLPDALAAGPVSGPSVEKSIAPLRSCVAEPMRHGRLLLAGDAAHIVPPTGAKGLSSAGADTHCLANAFVDHCTRQDDRGLEGCSRKALARVWKAQRFSWWLTSLLHCFPDSRGLDRRLQDSELDDLLGSRPAQAALAENYGGLPY